MSPTEPDATTPEPAPSEPAPAPEDVAEPDPEDRTTPDPDDDTAPDPEDDAAPDPEDDAAPDPEDDAEADAEADATPGAGPAKEPQRAWQRLLRAGSPRATRANVLAMVLAGALGFAIIAQVRQTSIEGLENLREDELVRIFADVDQDGDRLAAEIRGLESSLSLLESQSTNEAEAQRAAQERLDALGILAGTVPARGPGIVLTIDDPQGEVTSSIILDTIQELRDAGAEAIQVDDVRVVADTWFSQIDGGLSVSGREVRPPYVITAIGDPNTLAGAMEIPGGVTATVRRVGGDTDVAIKEQVDVDALLTATPPQYARPVPTTTP